jgi:hypothetical protein
MCRCLSSRVPMKKALGFFIFICIVFLLQGIAHGAQTGTSLATFSFQAIDEIAISGAPTLTINSAVAGQQPDPAINTSSTYSISTNGANKRITASISKQMPAYTTLEIQLAAPAMGTSMGYVTLSTTAEDVVTGITREAASNKTITYRFSATTAAGVLTDSCTVTLTLTD